ncbi:LysR substrate-binding domain-containing protein [Halotalea alkalilenta]|uniref:LysR substrate-binding domain-containing protein n=1 Tax=Halotalea alkalilenta TaxID=376489 RepID=UPI000487C53B|nr:LysR substrate-binding domain-containing protein [Halotalea alkalilenta]
MQRLNATTYAGLHIFAIAAEELSFTRAAARLSVTTGAVSQQIKQLEERLGFRLFRRHPRRLELTAEGKRLAATVSGAYTEVDDEVRRLSHGLMSGELRLRSVPSFLSKWLMPRLPRLQARFPDIALHLRAEDSDRALIEGEFDLALDLNDGHYPGLRTSALFEEEIFPVCAPQLLKRRPALYQASDLAYYPLLHDVTAWRGSGEHAEWEYYLRAIGTTGVNVRRGYTFNRNSLTIEAAIRGMGVAIARRTLITDELASGRLIMPLKRAVATGKRYVIVHAPGALDDPRVRALHDWLLEEAQRDSAPLA